MCPRGMEPTPTPTPKLRKAWGPAVWPAISAGVGWRQSQIHAHSQPPRLRRGTLCCPLGFLLSFSQLPGSGTLLLFSNLFIPPSNKRICGQDRGASAGLPQVLPAEHTQGPQRKGPPRLTCTHALALGLAHTPPFTARASREVTRPLTAPLPLLWASEVPLTAHPGDSTRSWPSQAHEASGASSHPRPGPDRSPPGGPEAGLRRIERGSESGSRWAGTPSGEQRRLLPRSLGQLGRAALGLEGWQGPA